MQSSKRRDYIASIPILKKGVRILRPAEYDQLRSVIKPNQQALLDGLTLTGMRYIEAQRFQENPAWLDSNAKFIHLPKGASLKVKAKFDERIIRLSNTGSLLIPSFLRGDKLPSRITWDENLKRWSAKAGLDPKGICAKTTRKTWESWLVYYYPMNAIEIQIRQGHTSKTSIQHYLDMAFVDEDKARMKRWVEGWI